MDRKPINPLMLAVTIVWTLTTFAAFASGEVTFYIQREGSIEDTGHADLIDLLAAYDEVDFEDEGLAPLHGEVPELWFDDLGLLVEGDWAGPYVPTIVTSSEFNEEGKVWQRALLAGFGLTIRPAEGTRLHAFGLWIFDDGKSVDSAYLMQAEDEDGAIWEAVLENEIPQNPHNHEIEGFIGVYSDAGLVSVTVTPLDPITGEIVVDVFEADHWIVLLDVLPPEEPEHWMPGPLRPLPRPLQQRQMEDRRFRENFERIRAKREQMRERRAAGAAVGWRKDRDGDESCADRPGRTLKCRDGRRPEYRRHGRRWQHRDTNETWDEYDGD